jgi:nucleoid-associated protein YgaU
MGLFSFFKKAGPKPPVVKDAPASTSGDRTDAANALKAMALKNVITGLGLPVENLDIKVNDDHVVVSGITTSQTDREKAILAIGNIDGIATVEDHIKVNAPDPEPESKFYEVKSGDTLGKIAKEYYGNASKYPVIFEANKPMLTNPDLIYPGQMLRIPNID